VCMCVRTHARITYIKRPLTRNSPSAAGSQYVCVCVCARARITYIKRPLTRKESGPKKK
jgi:hypothetical protein